MHSPPLSCYVFIQLPTAACLPAFFVTVCTQWRSSMLSKVATINGGLLSLHICANLINNGLFWTEKICCSPEKKTHNLNIRLKSTYYTDQTDNIGRINFLMPWIDSEEVRRCVQCGDNRWLWISELYCYTRNHTTQYTHTTMGTGVFPNLEFQCIHSQVFWTRGCC